MTEQQLSALRALIEMCQVHGDFSNGVTDPTGTIDEGEVRAGEIIHEAAQALRTIESSVNAEAKPADPYAEYRRGVREAASLAYLITQNRQGRKVEQVLDHIIKTLSDLADVVAPTTPEQSIADTAGAKTMAFEQWASDPIRAEKLPLEKHPNGAYEDTRSYLVFYGWKSALKFASPAIDAAGASESEFKNFHRLLCERFGYTHDEKDWKRDQLSLIEHIASGAKMEWPCKRVAVAWDERGRIAGTFPECVVLRNRLEESNKPENSPSIAGDKLVRPRIDEIGLTPQCPAMAMTKEELDALPDWVKNAKPPEAP